MDYETKLELAHKELSDKGVWKSNYNPPIARLLRKIGLCFPPPYYQNFFTNFALGMVFFSPIWGCLHWYSIWSEMGKPIVEVVYASLLAGALFGFVMAVFYVIRRKQLNLTDWSSLGE